MKTHDLSQTPLIRLIDVKWKLKSRKTLTDDQAARLDAINAEIEKREAQAAERQQNAKLSAAWDRYLFDV